MLSLPELAKRAFFLTPLGKGSIGFFFSLSFRKRVGERAFPRETKMLTPSEIPRPATMIHGNAGETTTRDPKNRQLFAANLITLESTSYLGRCAGNLWSPNLENGTRGLLSPEMIPNKRRS